MKAETGYTVFAFTVSLVVEKNIVNAVWAELGQELDPETPGVTFCENRKASIFLKKGELTYGLIAHECLHAINFMHQATGHKGTPDDDEFTAYMLEDLVGWVHKELKAGGCVVEVD